MNNTLKAHLSMLFTSLIAGFNYSISKEVMPHYISPSGIIVVRSICAAIVFFTVHTLFIKEKVERKDIPKIFLCAILGITANQLLFYEGLNRTSPINASLMMTSVPIIVIITSAIIIKEKITFLKISGIIVGATGAIFLLTNSNIQSGQSSFAGDLMILLNAVAYATFLVLLKPLLTKYHPFTLVKWMFSFGMVMVIPFGFTDLLQVEWNNIPINIWLCIGFIIIFATFFAYYFNVGVLRFINPSIAGIYIYLQPLLASVIAISLGKDQLTIEKAACSALILLGVFLVSKKKNENIKQKA